MSGVSKAIGSSERDEVVRRQRPSAQHVESVRLYIFDCGRISGVGSKEFGFRDGELPNEMFTPCFLVVHPKGTLMWDTGEIPDTDFQADGTPATLRSFIVNKPLLPQLDTVGYTPADIDYLGFSHYHNDHVANANAFAGSMWLVQRAERDAMFAIEPDPERNGPITPNTALFSKLATSTTTIIDNRDHDVFGDGKVVIKFTPGHTPGHQSLFLRLDNTGPLLLAGDLYHYSQELGREADFVNHADNAQVTRSRVAIERFVREEGAQLWIGHDAAQGDALVKSPDFYD